MNNLLLLTCISLGMIVAIGYFNEKITHLTNEIALMLFATILGFVITMIWSSFRHMTVQELLESIRIFNPEKFLLHGVLCFMLFAGSCHLQLNKFVSHARQVGVLAFVCTLIGALLYGGLFYLVSQAFHLGFTLPMCLMFGSIIAPTDPIAATSILSKFGLPEQTGFLMEAESLLNDGVGVALFVCFSGMVKADGKSNFLLLMLREIGGAVIIGAAVMGLCWLIFSRTGDIHRKIFVSLFAVSLSYLLCEAADCSGALACVVAGVCFSTLQEKTASEKGESDRQKFEFFWETLDVFFNSVLYVILGLTFVRVIQMNRISGLLIIAIALNLISRFCSLFIGTWLMGSLPDGHNRFSFTALYTWSGLRGGLSIALAMSAADLLPEQIYFILLGCTYAIVFFTTVVQGLTVKRVYNQVSTAK